LRFLIFSYFLTYKQSGKHIGKVVFELLVDNALRRIQVMKRGYLLDSVDGSAALGYERIDGNIWIRPSIEPAHISIAKGNEDVLVSKRVTFFTQFQTPDVDTFSALTPSEGLSVLRLPIFGG
jgi:hypothetical protein